MMNCESKLDAEWDYKILFDSEADTFVYKHVQPTILLEQHSKTCIHTVS